jgi:hypothetical protein
VRELRISENGDALGTGRVSEAVEMPRVAAGNAVTSAGDRYESTGIF